MIGWQRQLTEAQQKYSAYTQMGYEWLRKSVPEIERMARAAQELASGLSGGSSKPPAQVLPNTPGQMGTPTRAYAEGGPVSRTGPALVHENEFVVPQHGALVMRTSQNQTDSSNVTLEQILALLKEGGGKILIDKDQLQADGFIHIENFNHSYP